MLHKEIFTLEQIELFHLLKEARRRSFYMVGGTAIALHLGHRKSIDFDLFLRKKFDTKNISLILDASKCVLQRRYAFEPGNVTGLINDVKVTFFHFPFPVVASVDFE